MRISARCFTVIVVLEMQLVDGIVRIFLVMASLEVLVMIFSVIAVLGELVRISSDIVVLEMRLMDGIVRILLFIASLEELVLIFLVIVVLEMQLATGIVLIFFLVLAGMGELVRIFVRSWWLSSFPHAGRPFLRWTRKAMEPFRRKSWASR